MSQPFPRISLEAHPSTSARPVGIGQVLRWLDRSMIIVLAYPRRERSAAGRPALALRSRARSVPVGTHFAAYGELVLPFAGKAKPGKWQRDARQLPWARRAL